MNKFGFGTLAAGATAAVLAFATMPATAKDSTKVVDGSQPAPSVQAPKATKYCIFQEVTGSIRVGRVCKTRDEWMRDGVDPLELQK